MDFISLKKNLGKDTSQMSKIKLGILGDSSTQFLNQAIKGYGIERNIDFDIYEADYNQIDQDILCKSSKLYSFNPEYVIIFQSSHKLVQNFYKLNEDGKHRFAENHTGNLTNLYATLNENSSAKIIYCNFYEINDAVFGNYAYKTTVSFPYQLKRINFELTNLSIKYDNFFICDCASIFCKNGFFASFDPSLYINADMTYNLDILPDIAKNITDIILAQKGDFKKCVILDLDDTLWKGIIGEDGIENIQLGNIGIGKAFTEFQLWLKQLKERGILLCVCSKNDESTAREPFLNHPAMVLNLDDISVFVANWNNKPDNIRYIRKELNISFESMIFIDDSKFERNMVRKEIPAITVPELPDDPAYYLPFLQGLNLFETGSYTLNDKDRTKMYQTEIMRKELESKSMSADDYLKSLNMKSVIKEFNQFDIPRITQLIQRSNQFNLRTKRYTQQDIVSFMESGRHITMTFRLEDIYGEYDIVSVIILEKQDSAFFIDTWIMSCRVFNRTLEQFVLNSIVKRCLKSNIKVLTGEYIETKKNNIVKGLFNKFGFIEKENLWVLDIASFNENKTYIENIDEQEEICV